MDTEKIESLVYQLLEALGEDPNREGLVETPKRVAQMMAEVYEGIQYTNAEIAEMYGKTFEVDTNQAMRQQYDIFKDEPLFMIVVNGLDDDDSSDTVMYR